MTKDEAQKFEEFVKNFGVEDFDRLIFYCFLKRLEKTKRQLGLIQIGDMSIAFGRGREWQPKIASLFQIWFVSEQVNSTLPPEQETRIRTEKLQAFMDSCDREQCKLLITYLTERLNQWDSTSEAADQQMPKSSSSEKLLGEKKNDKEFPS